MIYTLFMIAGSIIIFFGLLGSIILPDIFLRFHASTKCGVTGTITILIGLMIYSGNIQTIFKLILICLFTLITAPIVVHILGVSYYSDEGDPE